MFLCWGGRVYNLTALHGVILQGPAGSGRKLSGSGQSSQVSSRSGSKYDSEFQAWGPTESIEIKCKRRL